MFLEWSLIQWWLLHLFLFFYISFFYLENVYYAGVYWSVWVWAKTTKQDNSVHLGNSKIINIIIIISFKMLFSWIAKKEVITVCGREVSRSKSREITTKTEWRNFRGWQSVSLGVSFEWLTAKASLHIFYKDHLILSILLILTERCCTFLSVFV